MPIEEQLSEGARAYERRTQLASFERLTKTVVKPVLRTARSWPELHERLAGQGFEYELGGTGARIRWGDRTLAASVADRSGALKQMEKRKGFGSFVARDPLTKVVDRQPASLTPDANRSKYEEARRAYAATVEGLKADLRSQREAVDQSLIAIQDCVSADINSMGWTGAGMMLNVAPGVAGHEHRRLVEIVAEQFRDSATALMSLQPFPSLDAWSAGASAPAVPSPASIPTPSILMSTGYGAAPFAVDLPGYRRVAVERAYHHVDKDGHVAVRDLGDLILVDQADNKEAVRLALLLAREKWGSVAIVSGDRAFRNLCAKIAVEEGITLAGEKAAASVAVTHERSIPETALNDRSVDHVNEAVQLDSGNDATSTMPSRDVAEARQRETWIYDDFPFLHDPPAEENTGTARQFTGLNLLVDAWLAAHKRNPQDFARLRPLASRLMQDEEARSIVQQMQAEGLPEAERITQQARFQQSQKAAAQQMFMQR